MEITTWRDLNRFVQLAVCGFGAAIAVVLLSLLFGPSSAHASSDDQDRGLLGGVTGLLDDTTQLVGSTLTGVTSVATQTVDAVVAVAPAPVQQPVAVVSEVVTTVTAPVQQITSSGVVSAVTQPVVQAVTAVPVVGDVVTGLGVDHLVGQVGTTVDTTLDTVVGAVGATGESLAPAPAPTPILPIPAIPLPSITLDGPDEADAADALASAPLATTFVDSGVVPAASVATTVARSAYSVPTLAMLASAAPVAVAAMVTADAPTGGGAPPGVPCPATMTSPGSAGSGPGAWAALALLPFAAHRAWVRRSGPEDDRAPAAPVGSTDVSPD